MENQENIELLIQQAAVLKKSKKIEQAIAIYKEAYKVAVGSGKPEFAKQIQTEISNLYYKLGLETRKKASKIYFEKNISESVIPYSQTQRYFYEGLNWATDEDQEKFQTLLDSVSSRIEFIENKLSRNLED